MNHQRIDNEELQRIRDLADDDIALAGDMRLVLTEIDHLHTWDGLMGLLDEHWPEGIIPTLSDDNQRDLGPRIVSLLHWVRELQDWKNNTVNIHTGLVEALTKTRETADGLLQIFGPEPMEDQPNSRPIEHDSSPTQ